MTRRFDQYTDPRIIPCSSDQISYMLLLDEGEGTFDF
jgi:hypothetical protein